jgi:hypothetical protein
MSIKSVLDKIGEDAKEVFGFLSSAKGQAALAAGEGIVEAIVPGTAGAITLANTWLMEIIKTQTLATSAGAEAGSSTQKAALAIQAVAPQALQFAQVNGLPAPTAAKLQAANDALVAFLNAFSVEPAS